MLLFEWTLLTFIRNGLPGAVVYVHKKLKPGFYNYIKTIDPSKTSKLALNVFMKDFQMKACVSAVVVIGTRSWLV